MKIALAGNPNCGKTTLFNTLTGSTAHVGNWPGVTVDKREGVYKKSSELVEIVDLPGIYSLSPYTPEEVVSRNFIVDEKPDLVINIVDATNLERNLYLTTQLLEIDVPVVIALNMMDVLYKNGDSIDLKVLEDKLGVRVVEISALKKKGISDLMDVAIEEAKKPRTGFSVLSESNLSDLVDRAKGLFEKENILDNVNEVGDYFIEELKKLDKEIIADVRGKGLMVGLELTKPGAEYVDKLREAGFLINCTADNVLRFVPPLIITKAEIDEFVKALDEIL